MRNLPPWTAREFYRYEIIIAPLSSTSATVDMLFGALYLINEATPAPQPLPRLRSPRMTARAANG
ncbi:MAG: hypothetical protein HYR63_06305 [Proteobacteria bacterium]|nr:hypothetical protein [Pseudomonadota bacterium]MBI3495948.1 hypothetical protein [Pseudomonadota bacterium]